MKNYFLVEKMKTELKASSSYKKTFVILSVLCILFSLVCCILGEILLPVTIATLALIYLFDKSKKRVLSICMSVSLVIINIAAFVFKIGVSLFSLQAIVIALLLCVSFSKAWEKSETSYVLTLIFAAISFVSAILLGMVEQGEFTFNAAYHFYSEMSNQLREMFVTSGYDLYSEAFANVGVTLTHESLGAIYDSQLNMLVSYFVVASFIAVGISFKLFTIFASRLSAYPEPFRSWRFKTSNLYAYFYVILGLISIFATTNGGVLALTVSNLYIIFMAVYVYVGINVIVSILSTRIKPFLAYVIIVVAFLAASSLAMQILAVVGVMFTIRKNNEEKFTNEQ